MSNIDDYFGGNKKRKVEPIDEDLDVSDQSDEQEANSPKGKAGNWDFLANMFGIAGAKKKENPAPTPSNETQSAELEDLDASDDQFDVDEEADQPKRAGTKAPMMVVEDPLKALEEIADAPPEDKANLLTQIFSAGFGSDCSDSEQAVEPVAEEDEQFVEPVKAERGSKGRRKRRGGRRREKSKRDESETPELDADAEISESNEEFVEDENFVEFEIEELDHTPVEEDEESRRGRSRRRRGSRDRKPASGDRNKKPGNRRSRPVAEVVVADEFEDDVDSTELDPRDIDPRAVSLDEDGASTRRRSRGRNRKRGGRPSRESVDSEKKTSRRTRDERHRDEEGVSVDDGPRREPKRTRRGRDRDREARDSNSGGTRRERVPTWKDAISDMIESNTKAHGSRSARGGRGGNRSGGKGRSSRGRGRN